MGSSLTLRISFGTFFFHLNGRRSNFRVEVEVMKVGYKKKFILKKKKEKKEKKKEKKKFCRKIFQKIGWSTNHLGSQFAFSI